MGQTNPDEHMLLDDNKYIADVLYEVKNNKQKDLQQSRLLFKKRMFRETDETITEAQFVNLSYVQVPCCGIKLLCTLLPLTPTCNCDYHTVSGHLLRCMLLKLCSMSIWQICDSYAIPFAVTRCICAHLLHQCQCNQVSGAHPGLP